MTLQPRSSPSYEWIDVEDKDARRKARSHVIREAKQRQKLDTLRNQKIREGSKRPIAPAEVKAKISQQTQQHGPIILGRTSQNYLPSIRTILEGLIDPFNQFSTNMASSKDLGLVDHCKILTTLLSSRDHRGCKGTNSLTQIIPRFVLSHFCYRIVTTRP